jgi:hypothetical protein
MFVLLTTTHIHRNELYPIVNMFSMNDIKRLLLKNMSSIIMEYFVRVRRVAAA